MCRAVVCAVAVVLASAGPSRADDAEAKAVAFVEKLGGKVERDEKAPGRPVVGVNLASSNVTDAGLKELAPLKNLSTLYLSFTQVTDAGVQGLQKALPKCNVLR